MVSYSRKHNETNGEDNRDGNNDNLSLNCGAEGPSEDPAVEALRNRQIKNFMAVALLALGAMSIAEHVHRVADRYPIYVALHTGNCQADKLGSFVLPLVAKTERRSAVGLPNFFSSHMFNGSALFLDENLNITCKLQERFKKMDLILEIETGVWRARRRG